MLLKSEIMETRGFRRLEEVEIEAIAGGNIVVTAPRNTGTSSSGAYGGSSFGGDGAGGLGSGLSAFQYADFSGLANLDL